MAAAKKKFFEENPCFMQLIDKLGEPVVAKELTKQDKIKQNYLGMNICVLNGVLDYF